MRAATGTIVLALTLYGCASSPTVPTTLSAASATRNALPKCFHRRLGAITVDANTMERFAEGNRTVFTGNVIACQVNLIQYADRLEVFFDDRNASIVRSVASGNVRVLTGDCATASARRAVYDGSRDRLVLSGGVRVWDRGDVDRHERYVIDLALMPAGPTRCEGVRDAR
jgi:lipopolysaccharide transport protein LptA